MCLISEINADKYLSHVQMNMSYHAGKLNLEFYLLYYYSLKHCHALTIYDCYLDGIARCKWSLNPSEPLLFIKYDRIRLNILDVEKFKLTLNTPIQLEKSSNYRNTSLRASSFFYLIKFDINLHYSYQGDRTCWIDLCPSNENLLASAGYDKNIKIYDRLVEKIVKTYDKIHTGS